MSPKVNSQKERVIIVIDGSNFYHYLKSLQIKNLLNFGYGKFAKYLVRDREMISKTYYIGAVREEKNNIKSKKLLSNQMKLFSLLRQQDFKVSLGYMLKTDGYHEKGVDVKITTDILVGAYENLYDTVILISSDTDLIPVIDKITELGKKIEYIGFGHRPSFALQKHASISRLLIKEDLEPFLGKNDQRPT